MKDMQQGLTRQLDELMQSEMSRGEFMQYIGVTLLGLIGITGLLKNLHHALPAQKQSMQKFAAGYGRGAYGR
ncbi:MAG: hypothetical protein EPN45_06265 [Rhizobiaceae bacterium]|nr:MAG: hypothetical protein EPN45_06265 [Rhizobiaceae bacterium]